MTTVLHKLAALLLIDQDKNRLSHTKLWSNIGYAIMCYTFVYAVMFGSQASAELWLIFGGLVIGNRSLNKWMARGQSNERTKYPEENQ